MRTDRELVEASRRGEHAAFGELVSRYQDVVCAVSYSSTGDRSISEDVAQETFVAAWQTLDRLRDVVAFGPWLCGIARNIGRKTRKRSRPDKRVELDDDVPATRTPFDDTADSEVEKVVSRAIARVPIACRDVLVLYYRENQSTRDVASALGITEDAVMQRLSRGRRYLAAEVTQIVERTLAGRRQRRDLVAAVLASIALISLPSRVDASPTKGSTMLKMSLAASALIAAGAGGYLATRPSPTETPAPAPRAAAPALHYGRTGVHPQLPTPRTLLAPAERAQITGDLALLPEDSEIVFGIDAAQLRTSTVWQRLIAPRLAKQTGLAELQAACGLDPITSIESIAFGIKGINSDAMAGAVVIRGIDKTRTLSCLASHPIDGLNVDRDVGLLGHDDQRIGFTFVDGRTLLLVAGPAAATREGIVRAAAGGGNLGSSPAFTDLFQHVHSEDTMWLVVAPSVPLLAEANAEFARQHGGHNLDVSAVYGSVDISDAIVLDARLRLGSAEQVAFWVSELQNKLAEPALKFAVDSFVDAIDVTADDNDLRIDAATSADQLGLLASMVPVSETTGEADETDQATAPTVKIDVSVSTP